MQLTNAKKLLEFQKTSEKDQSELAIQLECTKKKLSEAERRQLETELELEHTRKELEELQMALQSANGLIQSLQNELAEAKKNEHTKLGSFVKDL